MRKIKRYVVDDFESEVYACSLVDAPAIESGYVSFAAQKQKVVMLESDEKRMVAGPVLIPDKEIYRYDEYSGEEFYLVFTKKAVERLAEKYLRNLNSNNWTIDHSYGANGVYTMESWIKADMEKDKSVALGLDPNLALGTWFMTARIDSDEIWSEVKNGRWTGFSVEAWISLKEENFIKNNQEMKEQTFIEKLKSLFNEYFKEDEEPKQEVVQLEEAVEAEEPAQLEEETPAEEPVQTELEEQTEAEAQQEEVELASDEENNVEARVAELETQLADVLARLADANLRSQELTEQLAQSQKKVEELSKAPSAKPVNVKASAGGKGDLMDTIRSLHDGTYFKK